MNRYEYVISSGPTVLATIIADSKIKTIERLMKKLGINYSVSEEDRQQMIQEHYDLIMEEIK